jgi:hypothetical protein
VEPQNLPVKYLQLIVSTHIQIYMNQTALNTVLASAHTLGFSVSNTNEYQKQKNISGEKSAAGAYG